MTGTLSLNGVSREYRVLEGRRSRSIEALVNVSIDVAPGQVVAVVGETGCGKSSLARIAAGLDRPQRGSVHIGNIRIGPETAKIPRREVGRTVQMVFQDPGGALDPMMTVRECLLEPFRIHGKRRAGEADDRIRFLMDRVGLPEDLLDRSSAAISGGEQQRVSIARALGVSPSFLVADEPVASLDAPFREGVLELIRSVQQESNLGVLLVTHDLFMVDQVSDWLVVLLSGRIVEEGPSREVLRSPLHPYTQMMVDSMPPFAADVSVEEDVACSNSGARSRLCPFLERCPRPGADCGESGPVRFQSGHRTVYCHHAKPGMP